MPQPVRSFHVVGDQFSELATLPEALPQTGYLWVATTRAAFEAALPDVQAKLQAWTGAQLFELHILGLLTKQLDELQEQLFSERGVTGGWRLLLDSRNALHLLEDTCEDQRAAIVEWLDALEEWPEPKDDAQKREREQLRVRSRDVLEHI